MEDRQAELPGLGPPSYPELLSLSGRVILTTLFIFDAFVYFVMTFFEKAKPLETFYFKGFPLSTYDKTDTIPRFLKRAHDSSTNRVRV